MADRFLELTNVIPRESQKQYLDKLDVERLRGITVLYAKSTILIVLDRTEIKIILYWLVVLWNVRSF